MLFRRRLSLTMQVGASQALTWSSDDRGGTGLNVSFSVQKSIGGIGERADITVTGLSLQHIQYIATVMRPRNNEPLPKNYVSLQAGIGDDYGRIFEGGIFMVTPQVDSPDLGVKMQCISGFQNAQSKLFEYAASNVSFSQVAAKLAAHMNVPVIDTSVNAKRIIKSVSLSGMPTQVLIDMRNYFPDAINIYFTGGVLYVTDFGKPAASRIVRLSGGSGLIGTPTPTISGMDCRSLLRPSLEAGGLVEVQSAKLPALNGLYRITNLQHKGSSRGNDFYSEIVGSVYNAGA